MNGEVSRIDLYSRRVVGWSMYQTMTTQLVTEALLMAIWRRSPRAAGALLHRSDQGSEYTSEAFRRLQQTLGVTCSMSELSTPCVSRNVSI